MYRQRTSIEENSDHIAWESDPYLDNRFDGQFAGRKMRIHPGGYPEGATTAIFHVWRTDLDDGADIPRMGKQQMRELSRDPEPFGALGLRTYE
jgi:hypothetical protein